jgi:putative endonuclease
MSSEKAIYNIQFGKKGEDLAVTHFKDNGYIIIERNFRFGKAGEIDLIAKKNNLILFVEVKSRISSLYGGANYAVNQKKKFKIRKTAEHFLRTRPEYFSKEFTYRFDLLAIENGQIEWIEDIIR